ncbi:hypothetical protein GGF44_003211, partial [Coemansia sp. RSA 1694]
MVDCLQSIVIGYGPATTVRIAVAPGLVDAAQRLANEFTATSLSSTHIDHHSLSLSDVYVRAQFVEFCRQRSAADTFAADIVAALDNSSHNILAIFGDALHGTTGGGGAQYLAELRYLNDVHHSQAAEFIHELSQFLAHEAHDIKVAHFYPHGLDVASWLAADDNAVNLDSTPVAAPLSGLVQLVRVLIHCRLSGMLIGDYVRQFKAVTGYGQGMVIAAAVASAASDEQF